MEHQSSIWNRAAECMPREELLALQLQRLQQTLQRVAENVPCYQEKFKDVGFRPGDLKSLSDLASLPFTTKEDLRLNYPYGMFAVPMLDVVRIHSSSGTTGKPTVVGYTKSDLANWTELVVRFMAAAGVTNEDIVHIAFGYGLFTGAFGLHYGTEAIGASVIPISGGNTDKQLMIMQDYRSSVLVCTPSYALMIAVCMANAWIIRGFLLILWRCGLACSGRSPGVSRCALRLKIVLALSLRTTTVCRK